MASSKITSTVIVMTIVLQWLILPGSCRVGINYGTLGDNLPSPQDAINLIKSHGITAVRIFEPNHSILDALKGTGIEVTVGTLNQDLQALAASKAASDIWLSTHIIPYKDDVSFKYITLGNEVIPGPLAQFVFPAIQNMQASVNTAGLGGKILVTTVVPSGVLGTSYPPSQGSFSAEVGEIMTTITRFVISNGAPLMVNLYPYFAYVSDPTHISLDFALFKSTTPAFMDGNLAYYNLFDSQLDAFHKAMQTAYGGPLNSNTTSIVVTETGWPSAGNEPHTSIQNAQTYNNNVKNHALNNTGSPMMPGKPLDVFIFALFNENLKPAGVEQNFGSFYPNKEPVYPLWP